MLINAGDIIQNSWSLVIKNWKKLLPFALLMWVPAVTVMLLAKFLPDSTMISNFFIILYIAFLVLTLWTTIAMTRAINHLCIGQDINNWQAIFKLSGYLIWPLILISLLTGLIILGGIILLIVPGIIFSVWYCFASYAVILDEKKTVESLKLSKSLVVGRWRQILWRLVAPGFLFTIVAGFISYILGLIVTILLGTSLSSTITTNIISSIIQIFATPLTIAAALFLYQSAKANPVIIFPTPDTPATPPQQS